MKTKHSIRAKLTIILVLMTAGTIFLCWFINKTFLEDYYLISKQKTLESAYFQITNLLITDNGRDIGIQLEKIGEKSNITYIIVDTNGGEPIAIYYNVNNFQTIQNLLMPYIFGMLPESSVIKNEEQYLISATEDSRYNTKYIELMGYVTTEGMYMLLRIPVESIQESVQISNRFLAYAGIAATILAAIVMFLLGRNITRPILELAAIAKKMSSLDFDIKYARQDKDEIGILGTSINQLSEKLEVTISELKSANNELMKDIAQKEQIDEMRKEFLSNVSHELKTPIALIQGYAEGLKEGVHEDEESRNFYCEVIMDEADKMNKMVQKLLTLNQIEFGRDEVVFERFDMVDLIQGVIESVDILCKKNLCNIHFEASEPIYVWGDEYQLEEVVTNYISNAIHYAMGEKRIHIFIEQKEESIRVSVFNTGNPIPEEDLDKVWIKFYKVDKARTREYGGSGIGLSIVKAIMDSHHQVCGVENTKDGVIFWFEADRKI